MPAHNPTPPVNCTYGAPMGRLSRASLDTSARLYLRRVRLDSGGYDSGGAYWGIGAPLWVAMDQDGDCIFLRASTRNAAKMQILKDMEDAQFYR
jgi:hypothetical protein